MFTSAILGNKFRITHLIRSKQLEGIPNSRGKTAPIQTDIAQYYNIEDGRVVDPEKICDSNLFSSTRGNPMILFGGYASFCSLLFTGGCRNGDIATMFHGPLSGGILLMKDLLKLVQKN